ncbi:MAG: PQQ-binding-like beta-propeller repeat protein [Phycisphaerae bacterium]|jgi:hypothetical protein
MARCRLAAVLSFLIFCTSGSFAAAGDLEHLVSPGLLKPAELQIVWENKLAIETGESLEQLFILGNRIYGLSSQNYIVSLNREKGNMIFGKYLADRGFPVIGLGLYGEELFSIAGNKLVEIDPDSGEERSAKRLKFGVVCPAVRNSSYFYIGGTDKRMHIIRSEDKVQVIEAAAENDSAITSIVADEDSAIFATKAGNVVSIAAENFEQRWQFKAAAGIASPIVKDADSVFAASGDTNVYKLDARTGKLVWKYQTGAMLERGPAAAEKCVYQYVRDEGLSAIDKESGQLVWQMAEGVDLLAESNGKAYVITKAGTLIVMDNRKAKQRYSVDLPDVSIYAVNTADSKIYIADKSGRIACLKPIEW